MNSNQPRGASARAMLQSVLSHEMVQARDSALGQNPLLRREGDSPTPPSGELFLCAGATMAASPSRTPSVRQQIAEKKESKRKKEINKEKGLEEREWVM